MCGCVCVCHVGFTSSLLAQGATIWLDFKAFFYHGKSEDNWWPQVQTQEVQNSVLPEPQDRHHDLVDVIFGDRPRVGFNPFSLWRFKRAEEQKHFETIRKPFGTFFIILEIRGRVYNAICWPWSWPFSRGRENVLVNPWSWICPWSYCVQRQLGWGRKLRSRLKLLNKHVRESMAPHRSVSVLFKTKWFSQSPFYCDLLFLPHFPRWPTSKRIFVFLNMTNHCEG